MKTKTAIVSLTVLTLIAVASGIGLSRVILPPGTRTYEVEGEVIRIDPAEKSLLIRHEEIPGYMAAMTMPLGVKDPGLLNRVNPGDSVAFRLEVTKDDSWISRIQVVKPAEAHVGDPGPSASAPGTEFADRLGIGEIVPDLSLIDQNGEPFRLSDFRGKAVLLTFIYTRCPLPNFCPLLSKNFAELQRRLAKEFPGQFQLLSLTIDPGFDTPEILKSYAARYEADESSWTFATGSADEIERVGGWFGLHREEAGGLINHDLRTALISPEGKLLQVWKSNVWTPYEVQRSVRQALTGSIDVATR